MKILSQLREAEKEHEEWGGTCCRNACTCLSLHETEGLKPKRQTPFAFVAVCGQMQSRAFAFTLHQSVALKHKSFGKQNQQKSVFLQSQTQSGPYAIQENQLGKSPYPPQGTETFIRTPDAFKETLGSDCVSALPSLLEWIVGTQERGKGVVLASKVWWWLP